MTTTESTFDQDFSALFDAVALCKCGFDENEQWHDTMPNPAWTPTTEQVADYFRDVMPPAWMGMGGFAVGEPHHHNERDEPVYLCFRTKGRLAGWEARYDTVKSFREGLRENVNRK